jgi:uncharacterized protein YrrD
MQFKQNATVYSADGHEVGRIDRVVLDPQTKEVTNLIIRQGVFLSEDKVVPISLVSQTDENHVELRANADDLHNLQNYEETYYVDSTGDLRTDYPATPLYAYPPVSGMIMGGTPIIPEPIGSLNQEVSHTEKNIPQDTVALKEGARVISQDDEHVGNIERVFTAANSGTVSHFLIAQGLLFKAHKLVPAEWVDVITEEDYQEA